MPDRKLSLGRQFILAYEDTFRVLPRMWPALVAMVFIMVAVTLVTGLVGRFVGTRLGDAALDLLSGAAIAYAIAPYLYAFCRAVAFDEVTTNPETLRSATAVQQFAAWLVVLFIVAGLYDFAFKLFGPAITPGMTPEEAMTAQLDPAVALLVLGLLFASLIFSVRATTLLPMLALDPPESSPLATALARTRGRFWFIAGLLLVCGLPVGLGGMVALVVVGVLFGPLALFVMAPLTYAIFALAMLVGLAASLRLHQAYSA